MLNEDTRLLLARCRRGDAEAQSELLRAIQPRLYFYCLKMLKDERRAQDTERKIFCEVLNGLSELKNDEDFPLRTVSTAARLCRAAARNAAPEQADSAPFIDGPDAGPAGTRRARQRGEPLSRRRAHCRPARCTARMRADVLLSRNEHQRDRSRSCHFRKRGKNAASAARRAP